jgi:hypothetical protein
MQLFAVAPSTREEQADRQALVRLQILDEPAEPVGSSDAGELLCGVGH